MTMAPTPSRSELRLPPLLHCISSRPAFLISVFISVSVSFSVGAWWACCEIAIGEGLPYAILTHKVECVFVDLVPRFDSQFLAKHIHVDGAITELHVQLFFQGQFEGMQTNFLLAAKVPDVDSVNNY